MSVPPIPTPSGPGSEAEPRALQAAGVEPAHAEAIAPANAAQAPTPAEPPGARRAAPGRAPRRDADPRPPNIPPAPGKRSG